MKVLSLLLLIYVHTTALTTTQNQAIMPTVGTKAAKVLGLTNKVREEAGLNKVCLNSKLIKAAEIQTKHQTRIDKMTHDGPRGLEDIGDRVKYAGYTFRFAGENVASGMSSAKTVMNGWINSESHRKNLLGDNVHMGISYDPKSKMWTQVFGTPARSDDETCDVTTEFGLYGTTVSTTSNEMVEKQGPACNEMCEAMVDEINRYRARRGEQPICVSPKLMYAGELALKADKNPFKYVDTSMEDYIAESGYSWKKFGVAEFSIAITTYGRVSAPVITEEMVLKLLREQMSNPQIKDVLLDNEHVQIGIGMTDENDLFKMVVASTWDVNSDRCDDGSRARDMGVPYEHGKDLEKRHNQLGFGRSAAKDFFTSSSSNRLQSSTSMSVLYDDIGSDISLDTTPLTIPSTPTSTVNTVSGSPSLLNAGPQYTSSGGGSSSSNSSGSAGNRSTSNRPGRYSSSRTNRGNGRNRPSRTSLFSQYPSGYGIPSSTSYSFSGGRESSQGYSVPPPPLSSPSSNGSYDNFWSPSSSYGFGSYGMNSYNSYGNSYGIMNSFRQG